MRVKEITMGSILPIFKIRGQTQRTDKVRGTMKDDQKRKVIETLNKILEMELAGAIHYTHYSFMVFGYNRIPIVKWLVDQATGSIAHSWETGDLITQLGAHPSLAI